MVMMCLEDLVFVSLICVDVNNGNLGDVEVVVMKVINIEVDVILGVDVLVFDGVGGIYGLVGLFSVIVGVLV